MLVLDSFPPLTTPLPILEEEDVPVARGSEALRSVIQEFFLSKEELSGRRFLL